MASLSSTSDPIALPFAASCAAAGLDMLSNHFGDELLPIIMPIVQQRLQDADWRTRESGGSPGGLHGQRGRRRALAPACRLLRGHSPPLSFTAPWPLGLGF